MRSVWAAAALGVALTCTATAQVAILQIQVIDGEGGVHAPGSRSVRPLTVEITDETGRPVSGAAVSFHLPEDGPSGLFASGLRTDVATTDNRGRATLKGMQLNRIAGRFEVRIIASKEQARAGVVSFQYITEPAGGAVEVARKDPVPAPQRVAREEREADHGIFHIRKKWIVVAALVGGGAIAGMAAARPHGSGGSTVSTVPGVPVTIGTPTVSIGKP